MATRLPNWTELRNTTTVPSLLLAADYSEGGVDSSVSAYAITVSDRGGEKRAKRAIELAVGRALPSVTGVPEIHMKQIWSGQQRRKTVFHALSFEEVREFLRDLARRFSVAVPFSAVAVRANQPSETSLYRGPELYGGALQLVTELLAEHQLRVGAAPILIDRGDPFQMIHHMKGGPGRFGPMNEQLADGEVFCRPDPLYVDSAASPLVQAADFCAFVAVRLIGELQKLLVREEERAIEGYNFFLELINLMRINIDVAIPTNYLHYEPAPWELRTLGPGLLEVANHIDEAADGRLNVATSLHQPAQRMMDRVRPQQLLPWPQVSTCQGLTPRAFNSGRMIAKQVIIP